MFKDLLIDWVTELNEKIAAVGDSGYLTISLSAFNPTLNTRLFLTLKWRAMGFVILYGSAALRASILFSLSRTCSQ